MVTIEKFAVYKKYGGDIDSWVRHNIKNNLDIIDEDDWYLISRLMTDLVLIENNLMSDNFRDKTIQFIQDNTESEEVIDLLRAESSKFIYNSKKLEVIQMLSAFHGGL